MKNSLKMSNWKVAEFIDHNCKKNSNYCYQEITRITVSKYTSFPKKESPNNRHS